MKRIYELNVLGRSFIIYSNYLESDLLLIQNDSNLIIKYFQIKNFKIN
jgi:hypothetical protein